MSSLLHRMVELAQAKPSHLVSPDHYRIIVRSTKSPTFQEIRDAYDDVDDFWLTPPSRENPRYAICLHPSLKERQPPRGEVIVRTVRFKGPVSDNDVARWAAGDGYRLLFPHERELFAKAEPDLQRWQPLVDLGTYRYTNYHQKPVLTAREFTRRLEAWSNGCPHQYDPDPWPAGTVFLVAIDENS